MAGGSLTRRVGVVAIGRAASTFSILAVNALLTRAWPEPEFGGQFAAFSVVWMLGNTLVPIFLLGLPTSLLYFFPRRDRENRSALVWQSFFCLLVSGALLVGLLWLVGPQLADVLGIKSATGAFDLSVFLLPFLPYIFSLVAGGGIEAVLVVVGRPHWQAGLALIQAAALVGAAAAAWWLGLDVQQVLLVFSLLGVLRLLAGLWLVGRVLGYAGGGGSWAGLGECLRYTRSIGLNDAVGSMSRSVDRFVVLYFFQLEQFAPYHLGAIEVPVSLLLAAAVTVLVPEVSRLYQNGQMEQIGTLWRQAVSRLALLVLPIFFFLFFFADPLIAVYLEKGYRGNTEWIFRIFLLALPLRCAIYNPLLVGMGKASWALWGGLGDLLLNLALSIAFVLILQRLQPEWALLGPALATVVATYVQVALLVGLIGWHLKWRLSRLLPWRFLLRMAFFSCIAALAGLWVASFVVPSLSKLLLGGFVCGIVLVGLVGLQTQDRAEAVQVFKSVFRS